MNSSLRLHSRHTFRRDLVYFVSVTCLGWTNVSLAVGRPRPWAVGSVTRTPAHHPLQLLPRVLWHRGRATVLVQCLLGCRSARCAPLRSHRPSRSPLARAPRRLVRRVPLRRPPTRGSRIAAAPTRRASAAGAVTPTAVVCDWVCVRVTPRAPVGPAPPCVVCILRSRLPVSRRAPSLLGALLLVRASAPSLPLPAWPLVAAAGRPRALSAPQDAPC